MVYQINQILYQYNHGVGISSAEGIIVDIKRNINIIKDNISKDNISKGSNEFEQVWDVYQKKKNNKTYHQIIHKSNKRASDLNSTFKYFSMGQN